MAAASPPSEPCRWCGETHGVKCPVVRAIEYDTRGRVRRVEFLTPADYISSSFSGLGSLAPYFPPPRDTRPTTPTFQPAITLSSDGFAGC
jgi:hypothetical protein